MVTSDGDNVTVMVVNSVPPPPSPYVFHLLTVKWVHFGVEMFVILIFAKTCTWTEIFCGSNFCRWMG